MGRATWIPIVAMMACGPTTRPYADDLPLGTLCSTVEGQEHCAADAPEVVWTDTGVQIRTTIVVPEMQLGRDRVDLVVDLDVSEAGEVVGHRVHVPLAFECTLIIAHGDHCDPGVTQPMACPLELPGDPSADVEVLRWEDDAVYVTFEAVVDRERPACCENECEWHIPASADVEGPYRVTGVAHVALPPRG